MKGLILLLIHVISCNAFSPATRFIALCKKVDKKCKMKLNFHMSSAEVLSHDLQQHIPFSPKFFSIALIALGTTGFSAAALTSAPKIDTLKMDPTELKKIIRDDIEVRQALVTADFTRGIYSETAQFQDEIDVYKIYE